jgi:hypothetical protein
MKLLRQILIALVGGTVVLFGIALIFLPGPGVLTIAAGLAILAIEFAWARHWLVKVKSYMPGKKRVPAANDETSLPVAAPSLRDPGNK